MVQIKRAYDPAGKEDGYRVLVDRLWPRGLKKSELAMSEWAKELAPSTELRQAFGHEPGNWAMFQRRYRAELRAKALKEKLHELTMKARKGTVTLLYSARDSEYNNAVVLKKIIEGGRKRRVLKTGH